MDVATTFFLGQSSINRTSTSSNRDGVLRNASVPPLDKLAASASFHNRAVPTSRFDSVLFSSPMPPSLRRFISSNQTAHVSRAPPPFKRPDIPVMQASPKAEDVCSTDKSSDELPAAVPTKLDVPTTRQAVEASPLLDRKTTHRVSSQKERLHPPKPGGIEETTQQDEEVPSASDESPEYTLVQDDSSAQEDNLAQENQSTEKPPQQYIVAPHKSIPGLMATTRGNLKIKNSLVEQCINSSQVKSKNPKPKKQQPQSREYPKRGRKNSRSTQVDASRVKKAVRPVSLPKRPSPGKSVQARKLLPLEQEGKNEGNRRKSSRKSGPRDYWVLGSTPRKPLYNETQLSKRYSL